MDLGKNIHLMQSSMATSTKVAMNFEVFLLEISAKKWYIIFCQMPVPKIDKTGASWAKDGEAEINLMKWILILNLQNVQSRKPFHPSSQAQFPR